MDIKELYKLCNEYNSNTLCLSLKNSFKNEVSGRWDEKSQGMKNINSEIEYLKSMNEKIKVKILEVANINFDEKGYDIL
jgi:hypothetical protein